MPQLDEPPGWRAALGLLLALFLPAYRVHRFGGSGPRAGRVSVSQASHGGVEQAGVTARHAEGREDEPETRQGGSVWVGLPFIPLRQGPQRGQWASPPPRAYSKISDRAEPSPGFHLMKLYPPASWMR